MPMRDGRDLALRFFLQPGERQIFEHHACQLVQRHLDLVGQFAWLIPWLAITRPIPIPALPSQEVARFPWSVPPPFLSWPYFKRYLFKEPSGVSTPFWP